MSTNPKTSGEENPAAMLLSSSIFGSDRMHAVILHTYSHRAGPLQ
jgi:hypothetical protein